MSAVEVMRPPITTIASGFWISEPGPLANSSGTRPKAAIAHGLKTPLAILVDEAHQLAQKGDQQSAAVVHEQCRRMQSQIDYQIARARTAASRSKPGMAASLSDTADSVVRALSRLHADRGLRIENEIPAGVMVACEVQDLNEILDNHIDNACKHARTKVALRIANKGDPRLQIPDER